MRSLCKLYADLHTEFALQIIEIARSSIQKGSPIIRPIFRLALEDDQALSCDDEFLPGDEILIAPVVSSNTLQRNIYLPAGTWQDYQNNQEFTGPTLLEDYPAPLDVLTLFR